MTMPPPRRATVPRPVPKNLSGLVAAFSKKIKWFNQQSPKHFYAYVHPWTARQVSWQKNLAEGPYCFVWKAAADQTYADWMGWGINDFTW